MTYNGYRNFPTYMVVLWFGESDYIGFAEEWCDECVSNGLTYQEALGYVEEKAREFVEEIYYRDKDSMEPMVQDAFMDTLAHADIDFREVAESIVDKATYAEDLARSKSLRSAVTEAYGKGKGVVKKGAERTKKAVSDAKSRTTAKGRSQKKAKTGSRNASSRSGSGSRGRCRDGRLQ